MNNEDPGSFSSVVSVTNRNLTRLSRNVAVTASTVLSGDQTSLSNPSAYHRAMSEVTTYQKRIVASRIKEQTPTQIIQDSLTRLGGMRAPRIADELLVDLPEPRTKYSLFQNFEATTQSKEVGPEALGIRKEMATSELLEIDEKIAELKAMRKTVFERMAIVEEQQASNEPTLQYFYEPGQRIKSFSAGSSPIYAIDFNSPFGKLALSVPGEVQVWDLKGHDEAIGEKRLLSGVDGSTVRCLQVKGVDPLIIAGADKNVLIWDASLEGQPERLTGHVGDIVALDLSEHSLVTGSEDCTVRHWNAQTGKCIQTLDTFQFGVTRSLQHFDSALATGSDDGIVRLWDLRMANKAPIRVLTGGHTGPVTALHFSGLQLMTGSSDGSVRAWDLRSGQIQLAYAYEGAIKSLDYDSAKVVVSVEHENGVRVLTRTTNENHVGASGSVPVSAARYINGYLVAGRVSGEVGVWAV